MRRGAPLHFGLVSGACWSFFPLVVFAGQFGAFSRAWMFACACLVGVALTLFLWRTRIGVTRRSRLLACVPVLLLAEASWAFLLTLPAAREGSWPERWVELTLGIYWTNLFGLFVLLLAPLTYWNIAWVMEGARSSDTQSPES